MSTDYPYEILQNAFITTFPKFDDNVCKVIKSLFNNSEHYCDLYTKCYTFLSNYTSQVTFGNPTVERPNKKDTVLQIFKKNARRYGTTNDEIETVIFVTIMDILRKFCRKVGHDTYRFDLNTLLKSGILNDVKRMNLGHKKLKFIPKLLYKIIVVMVYTETNTEDYKEFENDVELFRNCFLSSFQDQGYDLRQLFKDVKDVVFLQTLEKVKINFGVISKRLATDPSRFINETNHSNDPIDIVHKKLINILDSFIVFKGNQCLGFNMPRLVQLIMNYNKKQPNLYYLRVFILYLNRLQNITLGDAPVYKVEGLDTPAIEDRNNRSVSELLQNYVNPPDSTAITNTFGGYYY